MPAVPRPHLCPLRLLATRRWHLNHLTAQSDVHDLEGQPDQPSMDTAQSAIAALARTCPTSIAQSMSSAP